MAAMNVEQIREKTTTLKKKLAEKAGSLEADPLRALKKRIRRLQRRRRKLEAAVKRLAGAKGEKKEG